MALAAFVYVPSYHFYVMGSPKLNLCLLGLLLCLLFLEKGLNSQKKEESFRYAALFVLASMIGIFSIHFAIYAFISFPLLGLGLILFRTVKPNRYAIVFLLISFFGCIGCHLYWLIPFATVNRLFGVANLENQETNYAWNFLSQVSTANINGRLVEMGFVNFIQLFGRQLAMTFGNWQRLAYSFFACYGMFFVKRLRPYVLPFIGMLVVSTGVHYLPIRDFYQTYWDRWPFIQAFRDPHGQMMPLNMFVSLFFGIGLGHFAQKAVFLTKKFKVFRVLFILLVLFIVAGRLPAVKSFRRHYNPPADIPADYFNLQKLLSEESGLGTRILVLPFQN